MPAGASSARPLIVPAANAARSSIAVAASSLAIAGFGGLLALLIALIAGEGPETDGFLAAYSVYLVFTLFGSTLRVALVPMMGSPADEDDLRRAAHASLGRLMSAGAVLAVLLAVLSPLLGRLLSPGADTSFPSTATTSLVILAGASYCQIAAAALSATLAAARRFTSSALLFTVSSGVSLALSTGLMVAFGVIGAAIGQLGGSIVLLVGHHLYLRRFAFSARPSPRAALQRETWSLAGRGAAGAAIPLTLQIGLTIALGAVAGKTGVVTAYSYAYFLAVLLSSVTSSTIAFVTMPDLVASLAAHGRDAAGSYFATTSPVSVFLYLPFAVGIVLFGDMPLHAVLGGSLQPDTIALLWDIARIFLAMCLGWAIMAPLTALALALAMYRQLVVLAVATVGLQAAVVIPLAHVGPVTAAAGHAVVGTSIVVSLTVMIFGRGLVGPWVAALRGSLPAVAIALVLPVVALVGPAHPSWPLATVLAAVAVALYFAVAAVAWPAVGGRVARLVLGSRRTARG